MISIECVFYIMCSSYNVSSIEWDLYTMYARSTQVYLQLVGHPSYRHLLQIPSARLENTLYRKKKCIENTRLGRARAKGGRGFRTDAFGQKTHDACAKRHAPCLFLLPPAYSHKTRPLILLPPAYSCKTSCCPLRILAVRRTLQPTVTPRSGLPFSSS